MKCYDYYLRIFIIFLIIAASLLPSDAAPLLAQQVPKCNFIQGGNHSSQRVLVLVQGWRSSAERKDGKDANTFQQEFWQLVLNQVQDIYQYVVFFSYKRTAEAGEYTVDDSLQGIWEHHIPLMRDTLLACRSTLGNSLTFDLVGHSMGGVVAFSSVFKYGLEGNLKGVVKHVIGLHSPINGVSAAHHLIDPNKMYTWWGSLLGKPATYDLKTLAEAVPKSVNRRIAKRLSEDGIIFWNLYNKDDIFVWEGDSEVTGFSTGFNLDRSQLSSGDPSGIIGHNQLTTSNSAKSNEARSFIRYWLNLSTITSNIPLDDPAPQPEIPSPNNSNFTGTESPADNTVVAPNQPIHKTWRVKNTGNRVWGLDHKLVFIGGNQMGAPNEVNIPVTEPGGVADISIDITAPGANGTHRGDWRLRNPQGTFFGDKLWVQIVVPETNNPAPPNGSTMQLTCTNCPSTGAPGQSFRPTVRVSGSVPLLQSRGDMLRNTDGNRYGAHELVAVVGTVTQGQSYDFTFYEQNPITAPSTEGTYESKWRVWQDGRYVGPEVTIRFEVKAGAGTNHPPNAPTLTGPGDWAVYTGNGGINLQAQQNGDPDGDAVTHYYFEIFESAQTPNSGWITSNSWSPAGLGNYGFQWRVKVRDGRGAESGWSEVRHFNINDPNPQIQSFSWTWCHEPWGAPDKICFCAKTTGGGLELQLNSANDGSDRGTWKVIGHGDTNLNCDNDNDRPPNWGQLEVEAGSYRVRLYARPKGEGGWPAAATADVVVTLPPNQRPGSPFGIAPAHDEYVNTKTVTLDWQHTYRTTDYHLQVSLDPNFSTLLVDTHLPPNVSEYTYTFADEVTLRNSVE